MLVPQVITDIVVAFASAKIVDEDLFEAEFVVEGGGLQCSQRSLEGMRFFYPNGRILAA